MAYGVYVLLPPLNHLRSLQDHHPPAHFSQRRHRTSYSSRICDNIFQIYSHGNSDNNNTNMYYTGRASNPLICTLTPTRIEIKVRSQSESAALNAVNIKVPRNLYHELEMCRQKWRCAGATCSASSSQPSFFASQNDIQSDSEGDDSLVSSSEDGGFSADGIDAAEEERDEDEDLGVVRDLELYDRDIDTNNSYLFQQQQQQQQLLGAATADATTPLVGSPSSASSGILMAAAAMASGLDGASFSRKQLDESVSRLALLAAEAAEIERKKAVRFADECGKCLETIRVMTEPSDYPPLINPAVIRRFRKAASLAAATGDAAAQQAGGGASSSSMSAMNAYDDEDEEDSLAALKAPRSSWKITFRQPASEYVKFRETLEHQKVALENVMLKNDVGKMVGTIKVANIAFEKRVFIRFSSDGWKSYLDRPAAYQSSPSKANDTFRFDIDIPRDTDKNARIEFCVCFAANGADGEEYWDSNGGKNFVLTASDYDQFPAAPSSTVSAAQPIKTKSSSAINGGGATASAVLRPMAYGSPRNDAYCMDYDNWAKFASWRNLKNDLPYW